MYLFLRHRSKKTETQTPKAVSVDLEPDILSFTPGRLVFAIVYHLVDEGKIRSVELESYRAAAHKLAQRIQRVTIARKEWENMANIQRLRWLLDQSRITVRLGMNGTARLLGG